MSLELLAIIVGLHTFLEHLRGMRVRVWTDNTGGEGVLSIACQVHQHCVVVCFRVIL